MFSGKSLVLASGKVDTSLDFIERNQGIFLDGEMDHQPDYCFDLSRVQIKKPHPIFDNVVFCFIDGIEYSPYNALSNYKIIPTNEIFYENIFKISKPTTKYFIPQSIFSKVLPYFGNIEILGTINDFFFIIKKI